MEAQTQNTIYCILKFNKLMLKLRMCLLVFHSKQSGCLLELFRAEEVNEYKQSG